MMRCETIQCVIRYDADEVDDEHHRPHHSHIIRLINCVVLCCVESTNKFVE